MLKLPIIPCLVEITNPHDYNFAKAETDTLIYYIVLIVCDLFISLYSALQRSLICGRLENRVCGIIT